MRYERHGRHEQYHVNQHIGCADQDEQNAPRAYGAIAIARKG
jgi:hypothetical protein